MALTGERAFLASSLPAMLVRDIHVAPACVLTARIARGARGGVVDARALVDALESRKLGYRGTDVIITGHQSWLTDTALDEISHVTSSNPADFVAGKPKAANIVRQPHALAA